MRNAFIGYTYQESVAVLFISKMDVERNIDSITIEAKVDHHFDDIFIESGKESYFLQIKDFDDILLTDLDIQNRKISIKGKEHTMSDRTNILFFRSINIKPNCKILGFNALKYNSVYIISLNREKIDNNIKKWYKNQESRHLILRQFFNTSLDNRKWTITLLDLPSIPLFDIKLSDKSIRVGRKILDTENLLLIEGKPGIGKSHLVAELQKDYKNCLVYRFWIGSQDKDYKARLSYANFIYELSKQIFKNLNHYSEEDILIKIKAENRTVIIDGLDHVENYNNDDLQKYVEFINKLQIDNKTIILSRPLVKITGWKKQVLTDWNKKETEKVLKQLYQIESYEIINKINSLTDGYPILVKYVAEHFKLFNRLPTTNKLTSVDEYYAEVLKNEKGLKSFSLFLCSYSFIMKSEISFFAGDEIGGYILEFINEHPYLFEIKLNRITLFHDSFNTYLREKISDFSGRKTQVQNAVYNSIMAGEHRFLSRFNSYDLSTKSKFDIFLKYSAIDYFEQLMEKSIDLEAIRSFYNQLRESLLEIDKNKIQLKDLYDLSLILNTLSRDHISTNNEFLFTYSNSLLFNGYTEEDITSNDSLFAMLYFIKTGDFTLIYNNHSNRHFDTDQFKEKIKYEIELEVKFFKRHQNEGTKRNIKKLLNAPFDQHTYDKITAVLENLYIHRKKTDFSELTNCIVNYIDLDDDSSILALQSILEEREINAFRASWMLKDAKQRILALGYPHEKNDYLNLCFTDFLSKKNELGSFDFTVEILNYIRLALHQKRKIDIENISLLWVKYHQRKDYSLHSIFNALPVFEKFQFISGTESIYLINEIQEVSEKGYRHLLIEYIENKPKSIFSFIIKRFDIDELIINWFLLPVRYINYLPERIFDYQLDRTFSEHSHSMEIDYNDIKNVLKSKWSDKLAFYIDIYGFKVRVKAKNKTSISILEKYKIKHVRILPDNRGYTSKSNSKIRFERGTLLNKDSKFIMERKLDPSDIAKYTDENYTVLTELKLYEAYPEEQVKKELLDIFLNALTAKSQDGANFQLLYYFPGNVIKLIHKFSPQTDLKPFYDSFNTFIEMSGFKMLTPTLCPSKK